MHGTHFPSQITGRAITITQTRERRWLALVALSTAVLIAQVDTTVVNLAVRPIGAYFHAGVGAMQWVVDGYNLVYAVLLLTGGQLADLYGRRLVFMAGAGVFAAASVLCAVAPSVGVLIAARAFAGVGAALLLPSSLAIIRVIWPDAKERAKVLGVWTGCNGLALALAPTLGGLLLDHVGWRSIFFMVVPLALAALVLAFWSIPESSDPHGRRFDAFAQLFGALALGALAAAGIESHGALSLAVVALMVAALTLALFIRAEVRQGAHALVPLAMFRAREFRGAAIATAGMTFGMYGAMFLLPLLWQSSGRLDSVSAGIALVPTAIAFVLVSPVSGFLSTKLGTHVMTGGGLATIAAGLLLIGVTAQSDTISGAEWGLALTGLGMGLATGPLMSVAVGTVAAARAGTAAALINVARISGATLGVAVLGAIYALAPTGPQGLLWAMMLTAALQFAGAAAVWRATQPAARP